MRVVLTSGATALAQFGITYNSSASSSELNQKMTKMNCQTLKLHSEGMIFLPCSDLFNDLRMVESEI